jgi:hypothetical protein
VTTWREIPGQPGYAVSDTGEMRQVEWRSLDWTGWYGYQISSIGDVRSVDRLVCDRRGIVRKLKGRKLKPTVPGSGRKTDYRMVTLGSGGPRRISVMMLTTFVGPKPFPSAEARHMDGDHNNECIENLAWGSKSQNTRDSIRHLTFNRPWRYRNKRGT